MVLDLWDLVMQFAKLSYISLVLSCVAVVLVAGCSSNVNVDVVDLNKVLDTFESTLAELDGGDETGSADALAQPAEEDKEKEKEFLTAFAKNLNAAKVVKRTVGVEFNESGSIIGFADGDKNNTKSTTEQQLFTLDIDAERNRVVASDTGGHYRDHHYRPRFGFFSGYMLGSMLRRNTSYYSGARASAKPDFSKKTMSPKNYHSSAVSKAKTTARSSSRSRSGSRGFSFGK